MQAKLGNCSREDNHTLLQCIFKSPCLVMCDTTATLQPCFAFKRQIYRKTMTVISNETAFNDATGEISLGSSAIWAGSPASVLMPKRKQIDC